MKPVILLLDDEADLLQVLSEALGATLPAYDIVGSTSFEEAEQVLVDIEASAGRRLSLVVVDHMLGGRTGLEFLERLHARFPRVPSILFTGQASEDVEDRARAFGARVLWKPIRLRSWLGEVRSLLADAVAG